MRVLFGKTFGLGNAVMAVPAIKALKQLSITVDVLIGDTPDDVGSLDVMLHLKDAGLVDNVYVNRVPDESGFFYDLAIMSIPFDGRWQNGIHFNARRILDGRTRPDPSTVGLASWKKHEVEYQMDNVRELGFSGETPNCSFLLSKDDCALRPRVYYLGVGYKKDRAGFWKVKHWGNENYAALVKRILEDNPMNLVYTSGDMGDMQLSIKPIMSLVNDNRFFYQPGGLNDSFACLSRCHMYIGNDTGMAHVAASLGKKVVTVHNLKNSIVKSHPWCNPLNRRELDGSDIPVSVDQFFQAFKELQS